MASYLITGCAKGLGLALATHLATFPSSEVDRILVTARGESTALKALIQSSAGKVQFIQMDPSKESSIKKAVVEVDQILSGQGLDVLINNAGQSFSLSSTTTMKQLDSQLGANVLNVHHVTHNFLPLLQRGALKKVINITPELGSTSRKGDYASFPVPAYKTSKAALNDLTAQYSLTYADEGFAFFAMSPDWLPNDMCVNAPFEEGAKATVRQIMDAGKEESGRVLHVRVEGWERPALVACRA